MTELGQLTMLQSYLCRVPQRNIVAAKQDSSLVARVRPGKVAFISSFVSNPIL